MLPGDEILYQCNETELLQLARRQGLPPLRRGIPKQELVEIVAGGEPRPEHICSTGYTRSRLMQFINENWERVRSQLPDCPGQCVTHDCTDAKHAACHLDNQHLIT